MRDGKYTADERMIVQDSILKAYLGRDKCVIIPDGIIQIGGLLSEEDLREDYKYKGDPIGYKAFFRNKNIEIVVIPKSVETIGFKSFEHCEKLTVLSMTSSVKKIETNAFAGTNLKVILFDGSIAEFKEIDLYFTGVEYNLEVVYCNDGEIRFKK